jgi:UDP-N-acetylglucosamine 1-carboxyvinyltransferase
MRQYEVTGGNSLRGEVSLSGSKNAATKMMVASMLTNERVKLENVPGSGEVSLTAEMMRGLSSDVVREGTSCALTTHTISSPVVPETRTGKNRIPILFVAPLLHQIGRAEIPVPGGDKIGARTIDFHINGYTSLGANVEERDDRVVFKADRLRGADITLPFPSVMATENLLLAAVLAEGTTVIRNVAVEPEIIGLIDLLQKMGAVIFHEPDRVFVVEGVKRLHGTSHTVLPDRIEAASFACAAIATNGDVFIRGAVQQDMRTFLNVVRKMGASFEITTDGIRFSGNGMLSPCMVHTGVHPGFMTDWQPPFSILLTQASGTSEIHETVYDNRFGYMETLKRMGADVELCTDCGSGEPCRYDGSAFAHRAVIHGPSQLSPADVEVPDIRAGFAYLIAALVADGTSRVTGIEHLERGYDGLVDKLKGIGAAIKILDQ